MIDNKQEEAFLPNGERNPYYPDPIQPDVIHPGPVRDRFPPMPRTVTIEENEKVAEIRDAFKNLRFKVSLTSFDSYCKCGRKEYQIQVVMFNCNSQPIVIVDRPEPTEERIFDYDVALKIYDEYVKGYSQLVKAETRDFQDIELYKEQIGYEREQLSCCYTCKWCSKNPILRERNLEIFSRLECLNPDCNFAYTFDSEHRHQPWNEHCHEPIHTGCDCHNKMILNIHPKVDWCGKCDKYELFVVAN